MDASTEQSQGRAASAGASPVPRRPLRKGTHSCAECKRRKTRCFFDGPRATKCVGCHRRSTPCISQEYVDVVPASDSRDQPHVAESLGRMQQMLEQIMKKTALEDSTTQLADVDGNSLPGRDHREISHGNETSPMNSVANELQPRSLQLAGTSPSASTFRHPPALPQFVEVCRTLHAAFPLQQDVDVLFAAGRAAIYLQALCNPYNDLFAEKNTRTQAAMSLLPPVTAHPVILARKLLHLALCIQQLDPSFDPSLALQDMGLRQQLKDAMKHYFTLATSTVTCHDDLLNSLEGLECLICESVYLVNTGSLRRALLSLRRALTLAQFMGFHTHSGAKAVRRAFKQYDPETRVSAEVTWVHLAWLERFVSLLLGIPTAITGVRLALEDENSHKAKATHQPQKYEKPDSETCSEWVEKLQVDLCEAILKCTQSSHFSDYAATQRIDDSLHALAESIPPSWWSPLDDVPLRMSTGTITMEDLMERMISAQIQIVHFTLIVLLHLPYLLRTPEHDDNSIEHEEADKIRQPSQFIRYSKSACTFACRQVLRRFVEFRAVVRVVFCCRPVDFCALTASLVLLVAHLGGGRRRQGHLPTDDDAGWLLPHHRLEDRTLVQRTIDTMAELNRLNDDELSRETADLAGKLLDLEARCVREKAVYHAAAVVAGHQDPSSADNDNEQLLLRIPYFGTVRLMCHIASDLPSAASSTTRSKNKDSQDSSTMRATDFSSASSENTYSWLPGMGSSSDFSTAQFVLPPQDCMPSHAVQLPFLLYDPIFTFPTEEGESDDDVTMPDLMADTNSWAFQGVDATVFDSLFRGVNFPFPGSV